MHSRAAISYGMLTSCLTLTACTTTPPNEPSVMVLPGTGKSFEQFRADNDLCKQYAHDQVAGRTPEGTGIASGVKSAALAAQQQEQRRMAAGAPRSAQAPDWLWAGYQVPALRKPPAHAFSNVTTSVINNACMQKDIASRWRAA